MIEIIAYGKPAPQGSKKSLGRGVIVESNPNTKPWRADVKAACEKWWERHCDHRPITEAIQIDMVFTFMRPKSISRAKRPFPSVKPDVIKLARSTEDAITSSGLWIDDSLAVEYGRLAKVYSGEDVDSLTSPGVLIRFQVKPVTMIPMGGVMIHRLALEAT